MFNQDRVLNPRHRDPSEESLLGRVIDRTGSENGSGEILVVLFNALCILRNYIYITDMSASDGIPC